MAYVVRETFAPETPPHTWRKYDLVFFSRRRGRNTSTYVEKIRFRPSMHACLWKHLHIRGENSLLFSRIVTIEKHLHIRGENFKTLIDYFRLAETPPHTWRKCGDGPDNLSDYGNTSTYVEKIPPENRSEYSLKKHLHIRGENLIHQSTGYAPEETPPHTWRKLFFFRSPFYSCRNTSTYVEKICCYQNICRSKRNTSTYVEKIAIF